MDYRIRKKKKWTGSLALCIGALAPLVSNASSSQVLDQLSTLRREGTEPPGNCYGYSCPPGQTENNCDDAVIERNLSVLNALNIVTVTGLSAFKCHGYCFSNNPKEREEDKCEKAEALDKLVKTATPLAVAIKN